MPKPKLTTEEVEHVAKLAKLELSETEILKFQEQLSAIVSYIDKLNEVDTQGIEPTSQTTGLENITRKDLVISEDRLSANQATSGSKNIHKGYFVVPMVLEERTI